MKILSINHWVAAVHLWLRALFGKANKCESKKCNGKCHTYNWAKIKGKEYDFKRKNFKMLCVSCHRKYDMTDEYRKNMSESLKNRSLKDKIKSSNKMRIIMIERWKNDEYKNRVSDAISDGKKGIKFTEEHKDNLSKNSYIKKHGISEETKKKLSKIQKTKRYSKQSKLKMSKARKKYWRKYRKNKLLRGEI